MFRGKFDIVYMHCPCVLDIKLSSFPIKFVIRTRRRGWAIADVEFPRYLRQIMGHQPSDLNLIVLSRQHADKNNLGISVYCNYCKAMVLLKGVCKTDKISRFSKSKVQCPSVIVTISGQGKVNHNNQWPGPNI